MKEKGDIKPVIVKVGLALAVSIASLVYSRLRLRPRTPSDGGNRSDSIEEDEKKMASVASETQLFVGETPKAGLVGNREVFLFPELDDLIKEFETTSEGFVENDETADLQDMVRTLRERESSLQSQLLEFQGLREQESSVAELRNQLKLNAMEAKLLSIKIASLRGENRRLQAQVADKARLGIELDAARAKIRHLKERLGVEASKNKEQILSLKQRVSKFEDDEYKSLANDSDVMTKLKRLRELEGQIEELNHSNSILRLENSDLTRKLESPEVKMGERARKENEELKSEVERLQTERCSEIEELVYLRWINACLRYELRDYHRPVARDLSKSLSPKSEEKAKQLIMEYANSEVDFDYLGSGRWSSSLTDEHQQGGSSSSSSSDKANHHSSTGKRFFNKLLRVVRGKDEEEDPPPLPPRRSLDLPTLRSLKDQSELLKFAEALNRSRRGSLQYHKKSASFGS